MFHTKVVETIKTHILCLIFLFENRTVYQIMWKNIVVPDKPQMTIWRMRIACWITKAKGTHSEYVTLIASPMQQRLHERASVLRLYVRLSVLFLHIFRLLYIYISFLIFVLHIPFISFSFV
jgi:hypothetical protein